SAQGSFMILVRRGVGWPDEIGMGMRFTLPIRFRRPRKWVVLERVLHDFPLLPPDILDEVVGVEWRHANYECSMALRGMKSGLVVVSEQVRRMALQAIGNEHGVGPHRRERDRRPVRDQVPGATVTATRFPLTL